MIGYSTNPNTGELELNASEKRWARRASSWFMGQCVQHAEEINMKESPSEIEQLAKRLDYYSVRIDLVDLQSDTKSAATLLRELAKDGEMLDWLIEKADSDFVLNHLPDYPSSGREAIRTAMKQGKEERS